jgi:hypothetical protein
MARVAKTAVNVASTNTAKENPFVDGVIKGFITLETVTRKLNSNGKEFVSTPYGAIYLKQEEIVANKEYCVKQFSNGALALNSVVPLEKLKFYMEQFPGASLKEISEMFNIKVG